MIEYWYDADKGCYRMDYYDPSFWRRVRMAWYSAFALSGQGVRERIALGVEIMRSSKPKAKG